MDLLHLPPHTSAGGGRAHAWQAGDMLPARPAPSEQAEATYKQTVCDGCPVTAQTWQSHPSFIAKSSRSLRAKRASHRANPTFALRGLFATWQNYICFACNNDLAKKA